MSAIEYGSYYWCVVLNGKENNVPGEAIHLHADDFTIEVNGSLTFRSAGRRPAGVEPNQKDGKPEDHGSGNPQPHAVDDKKEPKDGETDKKGAMIYVAFAPGSWRAVFAAKLQDGSPASIEHWNTPEGKAGISSVIRPDSGAAGYPASPPVATSAR